MFKKMYATVSRNNLLTASILSIIFITLGVVLLIGGLFLVILDSSITLKASEREFTVQSVVFILDMLPGVPFSINDLPDNGLTIIGLFSWIIGLDILLVGLGLWVKHKMAWWMAILIFLLATYFDFVQFLLFGFLGSPGASSGLVLNCLIMYLLLKTNL